MNLLQLERIKVGVEDFIVDAFLGATSLRLIVWLVVELWKGNGTTEGLWRREGGYTWVE
jgi:hypothetical protein